MVNNCNCYDHCGCKVHQSTIECYSYTSKFDMSYNDIGDDGMTVTSEALQHNQITHQSECREVWVISKRYCIVCKMY